MKGIGVAGGYFRVDGADLETGEESYLVLQAATLAEAEKVARKQGLLISAVRIASPADWGVAKSARASAESPTIIFEPRESPRAITSSTRAATQIASEAEGDKHASNGREISEEGDAEPLLTLSDADDQGVPESQAIDDLSDSLQAVEVAPVATVDEAEDAFAQTPVSSSESVADEEASAPAPSLAVLDEDTEPAGDIVPTEERDVASMADSDATTADSVDAGSAVGVSAPIAVESSADGEAETPSVFSDEPKVIAAAGNPQPSIFAEAVLSEENAASAISASVAAGERTLTATDASGSDTIDSVAESANVDSSPSSADEWIEPPLSDPAVVVPEAELPLESASEPESPVSAEPSTPLEEEQTRSARASDGSERKGPTPITVRPVRKVRDESTPAPAVSVTAKPVLIPKMILAENLRRLGQSKPPGGRPASGTRIPPPPRPTPPPAKAVVKDITLIAANDVSEPLAIEPGAKPGTSPRPVTATVVSRRTGRNSPAGRRSQQPSPPTRIPPGAQPSAPAQTEARSASVRTSAVAEISPPRHVHDQASRLEQVVADMDVARSAGHDKERGETSADPQPADSGLTTVSEETYPDQSAADILLSPAQSPMADNSQDPESAAVVEPTVTAASLSNAVVDTDAEVPMVAAAPTIRPAGKSALKSKALATPGVSPVFLFVLCPIASLLTLAGIALIAYSQFTSAPTAAVALEKLDFSVKMLAEAFVGGIALVAGLLVFIFGAILNLSRSICQHNAK